MMAMLQGKGSSSSRLLVVNPNASLLHQLITVSRQKENGSVQRTKHPVSTSTLHMTEAKNDMKGDSKAKDGEAAAKSASNVIKASYQCAGCC
jgi:hypothetical protein